LTRAAKSCRLDRKGNIFRIEFIPIGEISFPA
jgi:hypothetical protein